MLLELQTAFRRGLLEGDAGVRTRIVGDHLTEAERLGIYRNNVLTSLIEALKASFPAVVGVTGEELFAELAAPFVANHPPRRPALFAYGDGFADFLGGLEPVREAWFLVDLARLDWARLEAYSAADSAPLNPAALTEIPSGAYPHLRFTLHPSARVVTTRYAVFTLWQRLRSAPAPVAPGPLEESGENILHVRPRQTVVSRLLSPGEAGLLESLGASRPLAQAAARATVLEKGFDLQSAMAAHLGAGTFAAVTRSG